MHRLPLLAILLLNARAAELQIEANIRYSHGAQTVLDILQPRAPALKNRVGVIVIHGKDGSKESVGQSWGKTFVDHGWVVAAVDYGPDEAEEDVHKAAQWLIQHAAEYRVDPKRIVLCEDHLAHSMAEWDGSIAAVIEFGDATESRKGAPPVLNLNGETLSEKVFVWLKKHKIQ